jgi:dimethylargininase
MTPRHALVRPPPRSYRDYYAGQGITIDLALADAQHAAYVAALRASELAVTMIPADESFADGVFIEDTAVVWGGRMLVTRMVERREGEQAAVRRHLQTTHDVITLPEGARLEGGDVMHGGEVTYVGLTQRTNTRGADALRDFLAPSQRPVITVPVERCLHLKTAATWLGEGTLLAATDLVDVSRFQFDHLIATPPGESHAANTLRIGHTLLFRSSFPATGRRLRQFSADHGLTPVELELTEFEKGDGSLTCLSIIH